MADSLPSSFPVPAHFMALADVTTGQGLQVTEFMTEYTPLMDILSGLAAGQEYADLGLKNFDYYEMNEAVLEALAAFAASHWMDTSLTDEFWLKNYDLANGAGRFDFEFQKMSVNIGWVQ